jgi:hypothetical protein
MVYAMMVIALQSFEGEKDKPAELEGQPRQMIRNFRRLTAQSIILANIAWPHHYMVETLLLYLLGEFGRSKDTELGLIYGIGVLVRVATVMGYHRDSKSFPEMPPFMGEMRRRVWCAVREADVLFSVQMAMRPILRFSDIDTEPPRNIYDEEIYEDMQSLPPSRPITEATPVSYIIYKSRLLSTFSRILEKLHKLSKTKYEKVLKLDNELSETRTNIPPHLKMRPIEESRGDPPRLITQRYLLDLLFLRGQCVLHRKLLHAQDNSKYADSRRVALEAAMQILQHQVTLHTEYQQGGSLYGVKCYYSSITAHEFLLAAMIVSLDLFARAAAKSRNVPLGHSLSQEDKSKMMSALEGSRDIWFTLSTQSAEAFKGYGMLAATLDSLRKQDSQQTPPQSTGPNSARASQAEARSKNSEGTASEFPDAMMMPVSSAEDFSSWLGAGQPVFPGSLFTPGAAATQGTPRVMLDTEGSTITISGLTYNARPTDASNSHLPSYTPGMGIGMQYMDSSSFGDIDIDWVSGIL